MEAIKNSIYDTPSKKLVFRVTTKKLFEMIMHIKLTKLIVNSPSFLKENTEQESYF